METKIHDCVRHMILNLLDRVFETCAVPQELRTSIERQIEYELDFSLYGELDQSD